MFSNLLNEKNSQKVCKAPMSRSEFDRLEEGTRKITSQNFCANYCHSIFWCLSLGMRIVKSNSYYSLSSSYPHHPFPYSPLPTPHS